MFTDQPTGSATLATAGDPTRVYATLNGLPTPYGAWMGDLDGDGFAEPVLGFRDEDGALPSTGAVWVFGDPTSSVPTATISGVLENQRIGDADTVAVGDVNHDGTDDLLIGSHTVSTVYVFFGPVTGTQTLADADATLAGSHAFDGTGASLEDDRGRERRWVRRSRDRRPEC